MTDHKPLLSLFNPSKLTPVLAANRLARWALILHQYDYSIEYRRSENHGNADALSRLPSGQDSNFDVDEDEEDDLTVCMITAISKQIRPTDSQVLIRESRKDKVISTVVRFLKGGWPRVVDDKIRHFQKLEDTLTVHNDCLIFGNRIVIPEKIRSHVMDLLHLGHCGMRRMKQLARSVVYWPRIDADIEEMCRKCTSCAEHQNNPPKFANHPWMLPERPWSRIHIDHAVNFMGKNWLVMVDSYSKYPCIHPTSSITARTRMDLLEEDFAHFGYPPTLVTDNAPTFTSEEFQEFLRERGILHIRGAPYHPATNGLAERLVQTFKQSLIKSRLPCSQALQEFLIQYRRTLLESGLSPSELLNGRQLQGKLDALLPSVPQIAKSLQNRQNKPTSNKRTSNIKFLFSLLCTTHRSG